MSYTPTVWEDGDTITATKMNKLESGVASVEAVAVEAANSSALIVHMLDNNGDTWLDVTGQEILDAVEGGKNVLLITDSYISRFVEYVHINDNVVYPAWFHGTALPCNYVHQFIFDRDIFVTNNLNDNLVPFYATFYPGDVIYYYASKRDNLWRIALNGVEGNYTIYATFGDKIYIMTDRRDIGNGECTQISFTNITNNTVDVIVLQDNLDGAFVQVPNLCNTYKLNSFDATITNPQDGDTLVYNATQQKWVNGAGAQDIFVVTLTGDEEHPVADKTFQEVASAINEGSIVLMKAWNVFLQISGVDFDVDNEVVTICFIGPPTYNGDTLQIAQIMYYTEDGTDKFQFGGFNINAEAM